MQNYRYQKRKKYHISRYLVHLFLLNFILFCFNWFWLFFCLFNFQYYAVALDFFRFVWFSKFLMDSGHWGGFIYSSCNFVLYAKEQQPPVWEIKDQASKRILCNQSLTIKQAVTPQWFSKSSLNMFGENSKTLQTIPRKIAKKWTQLLSYLRLRKEDLYVSFFKNISLYYYWVRK